MAYTPTVEEVDRKTQSEKAPHVDSQEATVQSKLRRVKRLATFMDSAFRIPGTTRTVGLDSLLGLIPVIGDVATTAVSGVIVREALSLGVRRRVIAKMAGNILVDFVVGSVPLVGDLFDFAFKSNTRNVTLIERELDSLAGPRKRS